MSAQVTLTEAERDAVLRGVALVGWSTTDEAEATIIAAVERIAAARMAQALREAADQCDHDATDGHCGSATCAENNRITARWLRDRAEQISPLRTPPISDADRWDELKHSRSE